MSHDLDKHIVHVHRFFCCTIIFLVLSYYFRSKVCNRLQLSCTVKMYYVFLTLCHYLVFLKKKRKEIEITYCQNSAAEEVAFLNILSFVIAFLEFPCGRARQFSNFSHKITSNSTHLLHYNLIYYIYLLKSKLCFSWISVFLCCDSLSFVSACFKLPVFHMLSQVAQGRWELKEKPRYKRAQTSITV